MRGKPRLCLQAIDGISVADAKFKAATLIDAKAETLISAVVPAADHALAVPNLRQCRTNKGEQGETSIKHQIGFYVGNLKE